MTRSTPTAPATPATLSATPRHRLPRTRSTSHFKCIPLLLLVLGCQTPVAFAQPAPSTGERLHADAVASFRQARFSEAYGRFIGLADAGYAPAASMALWMYLNGPSLFGKDWDTSQDQLTAWAQLARQPVPTQVGRAYPQSAAAVAQYRR